MIRSKLRYKVFPPPNKTVTANKVIDTYRAPSPFIFFSTTDKVEFTSSERVRLTNGVETTMDALAIVKNAAEVGFAGHIEKLDWYFGSYSPETINCITEVINKIYKLLTKEFSCLIFFNITKPKVSFVYNKQWFDQLSVARKKAINKATDAPTDSLCKLPFFSAEEMKSFHIGAMEKWIEHQMGVNVNIDLSLLPPDGSLGSTVKLISSELVSIALDLDVAFRKINIHDTFSRETVMAASTLLELSDEDNWGSFIAFFTEPLSKHYLPNIMKKVALRDKPI